MAGTFYPRTFGRVYIRRVLSARGRSHETSCEQDRMRRLRVGLVSQLPGGFGPRPTDTTVRARGARSAWRGNLRRQARPGAGKCRVNEPRLRKLVWVERRKASASIARCANAFARCSGGSIARSVKGRLASARALFGAPFPRMEGGKKDGPARGRRKNTGGVALSHPVKRDRETRINVT